MPPMKAHANPLFGHSPAATNYSTSSHAVEAGSTPISTMSIATTTGISSSMTNNPENGDYFGQAWNQSTPPRKMEGSVRSPSSPYSPQATRARIKPGAKNSFAKASHERAQPGPTSSGSSNAPWRSSESLPERDEQLIGGRSLMDVLPGREEGPGFTQESVEKGRRKKTPSQKAMLSQALQKANHAVVLDNAQNFIGAIESYNDACDLLQQVMQRSSGDEEKRKLDAIRNTYKNRIKELRANELSGYNEIDKALPDVPINTELRDRERSKRPTLNEVDAVAEPALDRRNASERQPWEEQYSTSQERLPPRRQSLMPRIPASSDSFGTASSTERLTEHPNSWKLDFQQQDYAAQSTRSISGPMNRDYMPPPLSPGRPASPLASDGNKSRSVAREVVLPAVTSQQAHSRQATAESTSWLDTIDESGGSSNSSVHSRSSSIGLRRKHIRTGSGATEAEFDAALDAAVEAAYDDGFEPISDEEDPVHQESLATTTPSIYMASVKRNIDLAKQRVRDAEREAAIVTAREHEKRRRLGQHDNVAKLEALEVSYEDNEAEEEERLLEEMTREYILDDAEYGLSSKSTVPRKSDSSGLSGRTWGSSVGSMPMTAGTTLSTVIEYNSPPLSSTQSQKASPYLPPPPSSSLPLPPTPSDFHSTHQLSKPASFLNNSFNSVQSPGVRDRRLSGQKIKQLKIDTNASLSAGLTGPKTQPPEITSSHSPMAPFVDAPKSASLPLEGMEDFDNYDSRPTLGLNPQQLARSEETSPHPPRPPGPESASGARGTNFSHLTGDDLPPIPSSPVQPPRKVPSLGALRKNYSSSSLKSLKQQVSTPSITDDSPGTPIGRALSSSSAGQRNDLPPAMPGLPTPAATTFAKAGLLAGGLSFFESDIHSPVVPGSPNANVTNAPVPLEPCPESFLLRPFWLMRAVYQTIAHPRGGYISTRLFVPRDVWRVKNVKLKSVDEKVANCDLLTAALLNLQKVDTLDADALLEEMQAFELILDQVQGQLGKKLGTEVGVGGSAAIFKASPVADEPSSLDGTGSRLGGAQGKNYLSWKRLRSKHSTGPASMPTLNSLQNSQPSKETLTMRSLPMTSIANPRVVKRDPTKVLGIGPHSHYMAALGRLCDAVQILDQIARQVEDPGLRLSSQTHVGLELCVRHAAEFFAFFVCRFALTDIGMMLDKFVKRGSEWVLA